MNLRMNIRNVMVGMTIAEAFDFVASLGDAESRGYAEEFLDELCDDYMYRDAPNV